jgi:hypothetical protein
MYSRSVSLYFYEIELEIFLITSHTGVSVQILRDVKNTCFFTVFRISTANTMRTVYEVYTILCVYGETEW